MTPDAFHALVLQLAAVRAKSRALRSAASRCLDVPISKPALSMKSISARVSLYGSQVNSGQASCCQFHIMIDK